MHQLRRTVTTSRPLCSLASFYLDLAAARASHATPAGLSRPLVTVSLVNNTQQACWEPFPASHQCRKASACSSSLTTHSNPHMSRGFAAQSASRLKQSANRAKRLAQQRHGGRGGSVTEHTDPTSNESVATIPQEHTTVEAKQGQASQLQVYLCSSCIMLYRAMHKPYHLLVEWVHCTLPSSTDA